MEVLSCVVHVLSFSMLKRVPCIVGVVLIALCLFDTETILPVALGTSSLIFVS